MNGLTIQQAAEKTGVSVHTLRYYERIGLMLAPIERAANSHRRYSEEDVYWIVFLTRLRETDMPIAEIKRYIALQREGESTVAERLALLEAHRTAVQRRLQETERHLATIDAKIAHYKDDIMGNAMQK